MQERSYLTESNEAFGSRRACVELSLATKGKVLLVSRCAWNLFNFRSGVMKALVTEGYEVVGAASERDHYASKLRSLDVRFEPIEIPGRTMNPFLDLKLTYQLYRLYRREKPSIVHQHTIKPVIYGSIAARLARVPRVVNTVTGLGYVFTGQANPLLRWLVEKMYRFSLRFADHTLFMNATDLKLFIDRKLVDPAKADLVRGGVDTERFRPIAVESNEAHQRRRFLMVARLLRDKGIYEFVEAARSLKHEFPHAEFTLVGPRDEMNPTAVSEAEVAAWQSEGVIRWIGEVEDIRGPLAESDVVVLPSYREGTSKSLLEAAAMGKAIIATDVPGCREVVMPGINGLLVPPRNVEKLALAMRRFMLEPALGPMMGVAGRALIERDFSERQMVEKILNTYQLGHAFVA